MGVDASLILIPIHFLFFFSLLSYCHHIFRQDDVPFTNHGSSSSKSYNNSPLLSPPRRTRIRCFHILINKWVAWSCRAWLVGVATDFLRLWREAQIEKGSPPRSAQEKESFERKWWNEFMVATYWLPVAVHYSLYPVGIKGFNTGLVGFFGLMAGLNNFMTQWAATA